MMKYSALPIILVITVVISAVFVLFPQIDVRVSAVFHQPGLGFPAVNDPVLSFLRYGARAVSWVMLVLVIMVMVVGLVTRHPRIPTRIMAFLAALAILGPVLLVNTVLKSLFSRLRPRDIEIFGGEGAFTPAFQMIGDCLRDCSFVSGEAASATVTAIAILMLAAKVPQRWRRVLQAFAVVELAAGALLRVPMGGHFLSDVVLSVLFMLILAELLGALMLSPGERWWQAVPPPRG